VRLARALPWIAGATWIALAGAWLFRDRGARESAFGPYSVHAWSEEGLSLAFAYLRERRGQGVRPLTRPLAAQSVPADAVVFRVGARRGFLERLLASAEEEIERERGKQEERRGSGKAKKPRAPGSEEEDAKAGGEAGRGVDDLVRKWPILSPAEMDFVRAGGRFVLALDQSLPRLTVVEPTGEREVLAVHPGWPDVRRLVPRDVRVLQGWALATGHALFAAGDAPVLHVIPHGQGEVVLLSCPDVLRNDRLAVADHLALLERLAGDSRDVLFDETIHGGISGVALVELVEWAGLGTLAILVMAATLAGAWRARVRNGPPDADDEDVRTEAVDFVDSVAQLYRTALRRKEAVTLHEQQLRREVALVEGVRGPSLEARIAQLLPGFRLPTAPDRKDIGEAELHRALVVLNEGFKRIQHEQHR
jgi:hypothetical protein